MKLVGCRLEDPDTHGVGGVVPLPGLTVLTGANGSGKTRLLEQLASLLDRTNEWGGRRSRTDDEAYGFGELYLAGDWHGADWRWLHRVLAGQDEDTDVGAWPDDAPPLWSRPVATWDELLLCAAILIAQGRAGVDIEVVEILRELSAGLLVSYQPFPSAVIDMVVDSRQVSPLLSGRILALHDSLPDGPWREGLWRAATGAERFVDLFHIGTLDERLFDDLQLEPPPVVWIDDSPPPAESAVTAAIDLLFTTHGPHRWLVEDGDRHSVDPRMLRWVDRLVPRIRQLAPPFVLGVGDPAILVPKPELWSTQGQLLLGLRNSRGDFMDLTGLSAGTRRWLGVATVLATGSQLAETLAERGDARSVIWHGAMPALARLDQLRMDGTVLLVDEPELHLHPTAQVQIAQWLIDRSMEGHSVGVATHSAAIIDVNTPNTAVVTATRTQDATNVADITGDVLAAVDRDAETLGLDRTAWLQIAGALLVVEGEHDRKVQNRLFGDVLADNRVRTIPVRGHHNLHGLVLIEFFAELGRPVRVILDDVSTEAVESGDMDRLTTSEARVAREIVRYRDKWPNVIVIPYDDPDVICALPMTAVRRAHPSCTELTWEQIVTSWQSKSKPAGFKRYALDCLKISGTTTDDFVDDTLAAIRGDETPGPALRDAFEAFLRSLP